MSSLAPFLLAVPFTATITGAFNLSEVLPVPGRGRSRRRLGHRAWHRCDLAEVTTETCCLGRGFVAFPRHHCAGLRRVRRADGAADARGALGSSSLTGETLEEMFLPMIPYYIAVNAPLEMLIMPGLIYLGWRVGTRRILIVAGAAMYFVLRVWTYLAYVPARLGFAESGHTTEPMTAAERHQAHLDLKVDDPRWILVLAILSIFIVAAAFPRLREVRAPAVARTA